MESQDKKIYTLIQEINTLKHEKEAKKKIKDGERRAAYEKKKELNETKTLKRKKERMKEFYEAAGKKEGKWEI